MSLSDISTADLIQELRGRSDFRVSLDVFTRKSEWASDIKILVDGIPQYHQHMHGVSDLPDLTEIIGAWFRAPV